MSKVLTSKDSTKADHLRTRINELEDRLIVVDIEIEKDKKDTSNKESSYSYTHFQQLYNRRVNILVKRNQLVRQYTTLTGVSIEILQEY